MLNVKNTLKQQINQVVKNKYKLTDIVFKVSYPPSENFGDYASNIAMLLAKRLKQNPLIIAQDIKQGIISYEPKMFKKIELVKPGFINFYLNNEWIQKKLLLILKANKRFGGNQTGKGKTIIIDYSSPNIAKKMHVGHLRSTVIGDAIYRLHKFSGYKVIRDNHLGDWGTQFGKLIYMYKNQYGQKLKKSITIKEMEKLYINFHQQAKKRPILEDKARQELKKLQSKDKFNFQLWKLFYNLSLKEFKKIYHLLGVNFDIWHGESFYQSMLKTVVRDALNKKIARRSQGAVIIPLDKFGLPPMLIQKTDGAYLYSTTDLAAIKYKQKKYHPNKNLYVVANQQSLHFEQLFKASRLLNYSLPQTEMTHIKFGLILGQNGKKMSTRKGGVVDLMELIKEGVEKAKQQIKLKNKKLKAKELEKIAYILAIGAIKYNDLSQNRLTDIIFNWDKMLSLTNASAPYLQYTCVRINSILRKIKNTKITRQIKPQKLNTPLEISLIKNLIKFPEIILEATNEYKPNILANYLERLASQFHTFYEQLPILKAPKDIMQARLVLIQAVKQIMENGLNLLGIEVPNKM